MDNTAIILGVIGLLFLITLVVIVATFLFKLSSRFTQLNSHAEKIHNSSTALTESLKTHKTVAQQLPERVSHSIASNVKDGLEPVEQQIAFLNKRTNTTLNELTNKLSKDHETFVQALTTLNSDGYLTEWIDSFREVIEPLQKTSLALDQHYTTNKNILQTVKGLVEDFANVRYSARTSFERITTVIEHWEATESTHMRGIENRIMARLDEVADIHDRVANGLSEQQVATTTLISSNVKLDKSTREVMGNISELKHLSDKIDSQYQESYKKITTTTENLVIEASHLQETANTWLKQIATAVERWEADENNHMRTIEKRIMERLQEVAATHKKITDELSELQKISVEVLASQKQMNDTTQHIINTTNHLQGLVHDIESKYQSILSVQQKFQEAMHEQQRQFQTQLNEALYHFERKIKDFSSKGRHFFNHVDTLLNKFEGQLQMQKTLAEQQKNLMHEAKKIMANVPTRSIQISLLVLFIIHLLLMGILAYGVFKNAF